MVWPVLSCICLRCFNFHYWSWRYTFMFILLHLCATTMWHIHWSALQIRWSWHVKPHLNVCHLSGFHWRLWCHGLCAEQPPTWGVDMKVFCMSYLDHLFCMNVLPFVFIFRYRMHIEIWIAFHYQLAKADSKGTRGYVTSLSAWTQIKAWHTLIHSAAADWNADNFSSSIFHTAFKLVLLLERQLFKHTQAFP